MKTPDEIKKGLEVCNIWMVDEPNRCMECPYFCTKDCADTLMKHALALIRQLEAERDAMKALFFDSYELCVICKHQAYDDSVCSKVDYCCELCSPNCACHGCVEASHYEWRGVQKEDGDAKSP